MANYVKNRLGIYAPSKERLKEILDSIKSKELEDGTIHPLDFNSIDPTPKDLHENFSLTEEKAARYLVRDILEPVPKKWAIEDWNSMTEEQREISLPGARRMIENVLTHGHATWFDWAIAHWGTKWNAISPEMEEDNVICFQTAWSEPKELLKTLSKKFPDTSFKNTYADENCGYNCGVVRYMNGKEYRHKPEKGSVSAYELSFSLWPEKEKLFTLTEDGYEPIEE